MPYAHTRARVPSAVQESNAPRTETSECSKDRVKPEGFDLSNLSDRFTGFGNAHLPVSARMVGSVKLGAGPSCSELPSIGVQDS